MRQPRMNTASLCYSDFFDVAVCRTGLRIRNDEVAGSIPARSTICCSPAWNEREHRAAGAVRWPMEQMKSPPQTGDWRGKQAVAERNEPSTIVEHDS